MHVCDIGGAQRPQQLLLCPWKSRCENVYSLEVADFAKEDEGLDNKRTTHDVWWHALNTYSVRASTLAIGAPQQRVVFIKSRHVGD
jgi:hypothetical protein